MFTDISGFTKLSEGMKPKDVLDLLSEYQTKMVAAIFHNGGTVDKFIGDSVMATLVHHSQKERFSKCVKLFKTNADFNVRHKKENKRVFQL